MEKRDNDTLVLLQIKLHSSLLEVFPDLFYYDLITRRKKALLIDDIYRISQSIVENKVTSRVKQCLKLCSDNSNKGQTDSSRGSVARFCMENCVHDDADMVQCHLCQIWYHHDCAGTCSQDLENVVVWTCQICRRLPLLAKTISGKLEDVSAKLDELILVNKNLHQQNKELTNIVHHQNKTIKSLTEMNPRNVNIDGSTVSQPSKTLLIGSSLLRNVTSELDLEKTEVISVSGGRVPTIKDKLASRANGVKFKQTCLVVGGNDANSPCEVQDVVDDYSKLIREAKSVSESVTVSSLLPRKGGPQLQDKIDCINKELKSLCDVSNCKYIDNDRSFKLFDGAMNDALYCPDGTHLNTLGSSKLIGNLGLMFKTKQKYSKAVINGRPATPKLRDSGLSTRQKSFRHVGFNAFQTERGEKSAISVVSLGI